MWGNQYAAPKERNLYNRRGKPAVATTQRSLAPTGRHRVGRCRPAGAIRIIERTFLWLTPEVIDIPPLQGGRWRLGFAYANAEKRGVVKDIAD